MTNKIIIWDFNRTIYDPDINQLVCGAKDLLKTTYKSGYVNILYSKNKRNDTTVSQRIRQFGINKYFTDIVVRKEKNIKDVYRIINKYNTDMHCSFLISDRARTDIKMGNLLGLKTIWLRAGKFANELPRDLEEEPLLEIKSLMELGKYFKNIR